MKKFIRSLFGFFNLDIQKKKRDIQHYNNEMKRGLERLELLKLNFNTVVDVGAAEGLWSISAKSFWPRANFVLFEPLKERKALLDSLAEVDKTYHIIPLAAGKENTTVNFFVAGDLDGSGVTEGKLENSRVVDVTSIQNEIERLRLKGPFLIKLDTHGFEIPILEGCSSILDEISAFIIECYGFNISNNSLLLWEMCQYMEKLGFRVFDLVDIMHRPKDGAFWQCDVFFIKRDNYLFNNKQYS